jgi:hypothetical protein
MTRQHAVARERFDDRREDAARRDTSLGRAISIAAVVACAVLAACTSDASSSSSSGSACPDDLPAACPASPPSYARDVAPVIQQACTPCHAPGGRESSRLLTDYADAFANRGRALGQIHACRMPPSDAPPLSADGRKILLGWLVCGAPNN